MASLEDVGEEAGSKMLEGEVVDAVEAVDGQLEGLTGHGGDRWRGRRGRRRWGLMRI